MSPDPSSARPRHYFLNERHQLAPGDNDGHGKMTKVLGVDFKSHGTALAQSIETIRTARKASPDPTARSRVFILAQPQGSLERSSTAGKARDGKIEKAIKLSGKDSQMIEKMGFNLLSVTQDGAAIVHATNERLVQMQHSLRQLDLLAVREQNKWAHIRELVDVPVEHKTSLQWWGKQPLSKFWLATLDLQPFLSRTEIEQLIILLTKKLSDGERLLRTGMEYSGRTWIDALLQPSTIIDLVKDFQSIGSIHPPLFAMTQAKIPKGDGNTTSTVAGYATHSDGKMLPCVAVFDTGVPQDHVYLATYRRGGVIGEGCSGTIPDGHGSFVASRVVFGDVQCENGVEPDHLVAACSVYDVNLSDRGPNGTTDLRISSLISSMQRVNDAAPDVRVFNFSFDTHHDLDHFQGSNRENLLRQIADVDNKAFSEDFIIVVAAGNSVRGQLPTPPYPAHVESNEWRLRAWSRCFNALTCGGSADRLVPNGVAKEPGAPSPFTRIGPGFARSRKPDFGDHAGNAPSNYQQVSGDGLGVWGCNDLGTWREQTGTSFAAPLVAREAARTLAFLQTRCSSEARPFAALVKAVMALRARSKPLSVSLHKLAKRTLGYGAVKLEDIETPTNDHAMFLWQGIIGSDTEKLIVELPLPGQWVSVASAPKLRLIAAWDTPVNSAVEAVWACRKVSITLRPVADSDALHSTVSGTVGYPLTERAYDLGAEVRQVLANTDSCLAELSYDHQGMAPYPAGFLSFSPQQRVAIAYELIDEGDDKVSAHHFIQSLPVAATLDRLSTVVPASRQGVSVQVPQ
jgi:hypothetical protein